MLVAVYGLVSSERTLYRPLDAATQMINFNLWWGMIMLAFGNFMVLGGGPLRPQGQAIARVQNGKERERY